MADLGYRTFDADNHYYEAPDCFSRHIESRYREQAISARRSADGEWQVTVGDRPYNFMHVKFDKTNAPGSLYEMLKAKRDNPELGWGDSYTAENMLAAYQQPDARLELLDRQGVDWAILLPTFGVSVEEYMVDDVDQTYANLRAFNRWLEDDWGFAHRDRLFAPPLLSLLHREQAIAELDRVLAAGARIVHLRPCPWGGEGRSIADPYYDPFWARLNEARIPVAFHISDLRYGDLAVRMGDDPVANVREMSAFQWAFHHGDRPIMETFGALLYGNMHARFPNLNFLSIENGSDWVHYLLTLLDKKKGMARYGPWPAGRPAGRISEIFKQCCFVSPYPEDDVEALVERIGATGVLFGSDHPHPEGLADPNSFVELIANRSEHEQQQIMRDNALALFELN
ncbi:amidohydrolase family protein [Candidatus Poriferisocius sp.]|uniref:amidohydrolase family protein n=1 Tax=Candidatus Poriferisocius sp. TaxID=3101276 RepID=UPI003B5B89FB